MTGNSDSYETSERSLAGIELLKMMNPEDLAVVERVPDLGDAVVNAAAQPAGGGQAFRGTAQENQKRGAYTFVLSPRSNSSQSVDPYLKR